MSGNLKSNNIEKDDFNVKTEDGNYKDCNYNLDEYFYEYEFNSIREEGEEDSVDVTEKEVSTTHRRKDMDL